MSGEKSKHGKPEEENIYAGENNASRWKTLVDCDFFPIKDRSGTSATLNGSVRAFVSPRFISMLPAERSTILYNYF